MSPATLTADPVALQLTQALPSKVLSAAWATVGALPGTTAEAAVSTDGARFYLSHGSYAGGITATGRVFDPGTGVTTALPTPNTGARRGVAGVWAAGRHWALGGFDGSNGVSTVDTYAPAGSAGATGTWSSAAAMPVSRAWASAAVIGNLIYVAGGQPSSPVSGASNSFLRFDTTAGTWTNLTATAPLPAARTQGALVAVGTKLYYLGGFDTSGTAQTTVYVFDTVAGTWSTGTALGNAFSQGAAAAIGATIYVTTGTTVRAYNTADGQQSVLSSTTAQHGFNPGLVAVGSTLFYVSGASTANVDALDTAAITELAGSPSPYLRKLRSARSYLAGRFPAAAALAAQLPDTMPVLGWATIGALSSAISASAVSTDGTRIYHTTGNSAGTASVASRVIDPTTGVSTALPNPSAGIRGAAGAWCNGKHYGIGGLNGSGSTVSNVEAYTPAGTNGASGTWATVASLPAVRVYAAAAAVGTNLYVAGGQTNGNDDASATNSFYRFNGTSWSTLANLPVAINKGSLVAVGTKLYYVGGTTSGSVASTNLYVFDTVAGTWSTLADAYPVTGVGAVTATAIGTTLYASKGGAMNSFDTTTLVVNGYSALTPTHGGGPALVSIGTTLYLISGSATANVDAIDPTAASRFAGLIAALKSLVLAA